jgi:hypothetical protein
MLYPISETPHRTRKTHHAALKSSLRGVCNSTIVNAILSSHLHNPIVSKPLHLFRHPNSTSSTQPPEIILQNGRNPHPPPPSPHPAANCNKISEPTTPTRHWNSPHHTSKSSSPARSIAKCNLTIPGSGLCAYIAPFITPLAYRSSHHDLPNFQATTKPQVSAAH